MTTMTSLVSAVLIAITATGIVGASSSSASRRALDLDFQFQGWLARQGKTYNETQEYHHRRSIFAANANIVSKHNEAYQRGLTTYAMSLDGPFADLTAVEFRTSYLMTPQNCSATHTSSGDLLPLSSIEQLLQTLPTSVDWRTKGIMTPIKAQGHCGSCWTFSTTGTLEAHTCLAAKRDCTHWTGLAEQQLVDCAGDYNNFGCNGGLPSQAFEYIKYNGGLVTEESYVYTAENGTCNTAGKQIGATVDGVFNITSQDEAQLVWAIAEVGPVSVAYDVAADFRLYSHGVYDSFNATTNETVCSKDSGHVNHAVVAVGYGETMEHNDHPAVPFYIIRNSWGNTWGMEGHFWMKRGENLCGVSDCASFPLVSAPTKPHQNKLRKRRSFDDKVVFAIE